jgi:hypothetical protein
MVPDVLPKLLVEIRDDADVDAIVDGRVRGVEPAPGDAGWTTDGDGNRTFSNAFVVLVQLDAPRLGPRVPLQAAVIAVRCYGRTHAEAAALRWAVSNAVHNLSPRVKANGLGIYQSRDDSGGEQLVDPDTQQPYQQFVIGALATTVAVA